MWRVGTVTASDRSVAVVGSPADPQAERVAASLTRAGVPVVWVDAPAFPAAHRLSLGPGAALSRLVDAPPIAAAYLRGLGYQPLSPVHDAELQARPRGLVAQLAEKRAFLRAWCARLAAQGCVLVNSPETNDQHSEKPRQLDLLDRAGLPVPRWLATNDPEAVRVFASEAPLVYKPLAGGAAVQALEPADLTEERLDALALAPVLFQHRIDGLSIRVFVIGDAVIGACAIHSDALDYRGHETLVEAITPTPAEGDAALAAARACDMAFAGVDLIRAADGLHWVLESNPSPMFAAIEDATGLGIADALARYLASHS